MPHIYVPLPLGFVHSTSDDVRRQSNPPNCVNTSDTNYHYILSYFCQLGNFLCTFEDVHKTHPDDFLSKLILDKKAVDSGDIINMSLLDCVLVNMKDCVYWPNDEDMLSLVDSKATVVPNINHSKLEGNSTSNSSNNMTTCTLLESSSHEDKSHIKANETKGSDDIGVVITSLCMELMNDDGFIECCLVHNNYPEHKEYDRRDDSSVISRLIKYGPNKNENTDTISTTTISKTSTVSSLSNLRYFYSEIGRLKLRRDYREFITSNTAALKGKDSYHQKQCHYESSVSDLEGVCSSVLLPSGSSYFKSDKIINDDEKKRKQKDNIRRIRDGLLRKGMGEKKKHEVIMVHSVIADLLKVIKNQEEQEIHREEKGKGEGGHTSIMSSVVINVGEGKGYASKVISVCEGVPVIGLDCNPMHKEAALEREDDVLLSVSVPDEYSTDTCGASIVKTNNNNNEEENKNNKEDNDNMKDKKSVFSNCEVGSFNNNNSNDNKRDFINLQYETRGKMICVTCHIQNTPYTIRTAPETTVTDEKIYNDDNNNLDQTSTTVPTKTSCNLIQQLTNVLKDHNISTNPNNNNNNNNETDSMTVSELKDETEMQKRHNKYISDGPVSVKLQCVLCNKIFGALQNNYHSDENQLSSSKVDNRNTKAKNGAALVRHSYQHLKEIQKQDTSLVTPLNGNFMTAEIVKKEEIEKKLDQQQGNITAEKGRKDGDNNKGKEQILSYFQSIPHWRSTKTPDDFLKLVVSNCYSTIVLQSDTWQKKEQDYSYERSDPFIDGSVSTSYQSDISGTNIGNITSFSTDPLPVLRVFPRATMVTINGFISVFPRKKVSQRTRPQSAVNEPVDDPDAAVVLPSLVSDCPFRLTCSILGYDEGSKKHKVYIHYPNHVEADVSNESSENREIPIPSVCCEFFGQTIMMYLYQSPSSWGISNDGDHPSANGGSGNASNNSSVSTSTTDGKYTVIFSPFHVQSLRPKPPIYPSLSLETYNNVIFMGLHPCGDLGSNICRMYGSCEARGLLLLSCCWHALTDDGFPMYNTTIPYTAPLLPSPSCHDFILSTERKPKFNSVSRMLATQPTDKQDRCGTSDHLASLRLSFLRGLLPIFWNHVVIKVLKRKLVGVSKSKHLSLLLSKLQLPVFDRVISRRIAKEKNSINFIYISMLIRDELLQLPFEYRVTKEHSSVNDPSTSLDNEEDSSRELELGVRVINNFFFCQNVKWKDENSRRHTRTVSKQTSSYCSLYEALVSTFQYMIFPPRSVEANSVGIHEVPSSSSYLPGSLRLSDYSLMFPMYVSFSILRTWMAPLVEGYFLLDRVLYIHSLHLSNDEKRRKKQNDMVTDKNNSKKHKSESSVAIIPMFDGALSPRLFGIVAFKQ